MMKQDVRHDLCMEILHSISDKTKERFLFLSIEERENP